MSVYDPAVFSKTSYDVGEADAQAEEREAREHDAWEAGRGAARGH